MEYFIARKVREVFNVYRTVFKKIATGEVAVLPKDYATALRELADQVERNQQLGCPLYSLGRVNQAVAHLHYQDVALLHPSKAIWDGVI